MPKYSIFFARSARKELESLPKTIVQRVLQHIEELVERPRPSGCRKIKGALDLWRIRIGDYRVVYSINDETKVIEIIRIRHRSKAYE